MNNFINKKYQPRKRFSQIFLHNKSVIKKIITTICPKPNQAIIEIGPGFGALTKPIMQYINKITVIEIDHDLTNYLSKHPSLENKLDIIEQDAMKVDFSVLFKRLGNKPLRIFGNLPYKISTPFLFYLFNYINFIKDMHFMLQKEMAYRLIAKPHNKSYGRLSVLAQYYCKINKILEVSADSFKPKPKVDSVMIQLTPQIVNSNINPHALATVTNAAFSQRRKILRNSLKKLFNIKQLIKYGINEKLRAENLNIEQYCYLANELIKNFN